MDNKILAVSNHGTLVGGGEHSFLDLIANLSPAWKPMAVFPHQGELTNWCLNRDIKHRIINLHQIRPQFLHNDLKSLLACIRLIKSEKPNLIYANGSRAAFYGSLAGRLCSIPSIWHCRIAARDPYLDSILGHVCTHIIANSKATARRFGRRYQSKISVVYNGFNLKWLRGNHVNKPDMIQDDWKVILVVARLSKWKRHDLALKAFENVAAYDPDAHLICVGGPDPDDSVWSDHLKTLAEKSKFSHRIHWAGRVDDIRPWYRAATVLLLPSDNEPFGRVLIEAMANGVPVVATRGGGVPEVVSDEYEGFLVGMGNAEEMRRALLIILNNDGLRKSFSRHAQKKADLFHLPKHIKEMDAIFNRMKN